MATPPNWAINLGKRFAAGEAHAFLLSGLGVLDYATDADLTVPEYLALQLAGRIVVVYDIAHGLTFPFEVSGPQGEAREDRNDFIRRAGLFTEPTEEEKRQVEQFNQAARYSSEAQMELPSIEDVVLPKRPAEVLPVLETFLTALPAEGERKAAVILLHLETIVPEGDFATMDPAEREAVIRLWQWGRDYQRFDQSGGIVAGLVGNLQDLHNRLRTADARWVNLDVTIPGEAERLAFLRFLARRIEADPDSAPLVMASGLTLEGLAVRTAGLRRLHLEDMVLRARREGELTLEMAQDFKRDIIRTEFKGVVDLVDPKWGFDAVGGKEGLKEWFTRRVITPLQTGNLRRVPKGVLLPGPPGTGKSFFVEALAREAGVNFCSFNPANILGSLVGESEKNLERALQMFQALAPTIVFIDEVDQAFRRGQTGDSGVSMRIFRRILEFMADPSLRGRVIFLAASNRPDTIDAALISRFEAVVPVVAPDEDERIAIIRARLRAAEAEAGELDEEALIRATWGRTGRDLDKVVSRAIGYAEDEARDWRTARVETRHLLGALQGTRSNTKDVELWTLLALEAATEVELLPEAWRSLALDQAALTARIAALSPERR